MKAKSKVPAVTPIVITMEQEKETSGTWRYMEIDAKTGQRVERAETLLGLVYVPKDSLKRLNTPKRITVTIAEG